MNCTHIQCTLILLSLVISLLKCNERRNPDNNVSFIHIAITLVPTLYWYFFILFSSLFFVCVVIVNNIEWIYYCKIEFMSCSIEFILIGTYICNSFRKLLWFNISHADVVRKIIFLLLLWIKVGWSEMWEEVMKLLEDSNLRKFT